MIKNYIKIQRFSNIFSFKKHLNIQLKRNFSNNNNINDILSLNYNNSKPVLLVKDILSTKNQLEFTVTQNTTITDAINYLVNNKLSSALVLDNITEELIGIFTARDILRFISFHSTKVSNNTRNYYDNLMEHSIQEVMTNKSKLVYCSESDSVRHCREIMFQLKVRNLPILRLIDKKVLGIITIKDLADSAFNIMDMGGKKGFIHNVSGRKG